MEAYKLVHAIFLEGSLAQGRNYMGVKMCNIEVLIPEFFTNMSIYKKLQTTCIFISRDLFTQNSSTDLPMSKAGLYINK